MCRYDSQIVGSSSKIINNELHTTSNLEKLNSVNNVIILFISIDLNDVTRIYGEEQIQKLTDYEKERLVDNINLQARRNIHLLNPLHGKLHDSWKSIKYKISNVGYSKFVRGGKNISLTQQIYKNILDNSINSSFDFLKNIRITDDGNINIRDNVINVPIHLFIKWYIPFPLSNLDECLENVIIKNKDNEMFFDTT
jgi:hypothetical protein